MIIFSNCMQCQKSINYSYANDAFGIDSNVTKKDDDYVLASVLCSL